MFTQVQKWIARYYAYQARRHFRCQRYALCLYYLQGFEYWEAEYPSNPFYAGYLAICHYQLKYWDSLTEEVERALFLLRRHTQGNKEAMGLSEDLKSHLSDLRYIDQNNAKIKRASNL
jgi:hypothetical protein